MYNYKTSGFNNFLTRAKPQQVFDNVNLADFMQAGSIPFSSLYLESGQIAGKVNASEITSTMLADAAVTTAKMANLAVDNTKLAALAVDAAKLAGSAVTAEKIANLAVGNAAIAALAVGTGHIANAAITNAKINDLSAEKITAGILTGREIRTSASGDRFQVYPGGDRIRWLTDSTLRGEIYISGNHLVAYAVNSLNLTAGGDIYFKSNGINEIQLFNNTHLIPLNGLSLGYPPNMGWDHLHLSSGPTISGGAANTSTPGCIVMAARDLDQMFRFWTNCSVAQVNSNEDGGSWSSEAFDYAEKIPINGKAGAGDVVVVDLDNDVKVKKCTEEYQIIAGVISTRPGFLGGIEWEADEEADEKRRLCKEGAKPEEADKIVAKRKKKGEKFAKPKTPDVSNATALVGIVPCKVTNKNGAIKRGDKLASSDVAGHAMKATGNPIMGIAMENFNKLSGKIKILLKV